MKIDFNNTKVAFQLKSTWELVEAKWLFKSFAYPRVVKILQRFTTFCLKNNIPIKWIVKATVFKYFCGGETIAECAQQISTLHRHGVMSILDYSVEENKSEADLNHTKDVIIKTIEFAKGNPGIPFAVFKPSGIGRNDLFEKVSKNHPLTDIEKQEWANVRQRFYDIADAALRIDHPVMIDAEEVRIQVAIDAIAAELMSKYNTHRALIFNTAQMYRWDRLAHITQSVAAARAGNYYYGVKIVRGAYMEYEREMAEKYAYPDPIQPNKKACDRDFDAAVRFLLNNIDIASTVVATHNENSVQLVADILAQQNLPANDPRVYVAQLYGMSDNLSFNMAAAGYNVVKYMPFGPVKSVMPYLFRRAEENSSVSGQSSRELNLVREELKRRRSRKK